MTADLRHLYLGHLSRDCNRPELAFEVMQSRLQKLGADHVQLQLTSQSTPCETLLLEPAAATNWKLEERAETRYELRQASLDL
jgi:hypothetical protein